MNLTPTAAPSKLKGRIERLQRSERNRDSFYGFIYGEDGTKYFFHSDDVVTAHKRGIRQGVPVSFIKGVKLESDKSERATDVEMLNAQAA